MIRNLDELRKEYKSEIGIEISYIYWSGVEDKYIYSPNPYKSKLYKYEEKLKNLKDELKHDKEYNNGKEKYRIGFEIDDIKKKIEDTEKQRVIHDDKKCYIQNFPDDFDEYRGID